MKYPPSRKDLKILVPHALKEYERVFGKLKTIGQRKVFLSELPPTQERKKRGKQS